MIPEFAEENTDDLDLQIEKMAKSVKVDNINLSEISSSAEGEDTLKPEGLEDDDYL